MSDIEKVISSLERKGLLDEPSVRELRNRLKRKLKTEANAQEKEMVLLKAELSALQNRFSS